MKIVDKNEECCCESGPGRGTITLLLRIVKLCAPTSQNNLVHPVKPDNKIAINNRIKPKKKKNKKKIPPQTLCVETYITTYLYINR